jgi:hypothetical protein
MAASSARRSEPWPTVDAHLRDLIDEERADEGARSRRDRFWLDRVDQESMTVAGLLVAMGERRDLVRLNLRSGAHRIGRVTAVGTDVVAIVDTAGVEILLAIRHIASIRSASTAILAVDTEPVAAILRDQLLALTEERAEVRLVLENNTTESGTLEACGVGVVVLRSRNRELVYVAEAAIAEIVRATR